MGRKILLFVLGMVILSFLPVAFAEAMVGEKAPEFTATDIAGKEVSLAQYKGSYVVLEWMNYDCPFVKRHYAPGQMQALQKEVTDKGVVWISINSSAPGKQGNYPAEKWQKMVKEKAAFPTTVILDGDGKIGHLYDAKTTPHFFVVNPDGVLIYQGAIDSVPTTDVEEGTGAINYVRQALEEAMSGKAVSESETKSYGCSVKY